jgi:hypothetical protein
VHENAKKMHGLSFKLFVPTQPMSRTQSPGAVLIKSVRANPFLDLRTLDVSQSMAHTRNLASGITYSNAPRGELFSIRHPPVQRLPACSLKPTFQRLRLPVIRVIIQERTKKSNQELAGIAETLITPFTLKSMPPLHPGRTACSLPEFLIDYPHTAYGRRGSVPPNSLLI